MARTPRPEDDPSATSQADPSDDPARDPLEGARRLVALELDLAETRRRLAEQNLAITEAQLALAEEQLEELKAENERLRREIAELRGRAPVPPPSRGYEDLR
jgi:hypothetical protein